MQYFKLTLILLVSFNLFSCANSAESSPEELADLKKFSTIDNISLGMNIADVNDALLTEEKDDSYKVYRLIGRKVSNLPGIIFLYIKDNKISKIKFSSSESWMGSTNVVNHVLKGYYDDRKTWVQNAMTYYEIPDWQEVENITSYQKNEIAHQVSLDKVEFFGIQVGWTLNYIITSTEAIKNELQVKKDNLQF